MRATHHLGTVLAGGIVLASLTACGGDEDAKGRDRDAAAVARDGGTGGDAAEPPAEPGLDGSVDGGERNTDDAAVSAELDAGDVAANDPDADAAEGGSVDAAGSDPALDGGSSDGADDAGAYDAGADCDRVYREGHGDLFISFAAMLDIAVRSSFGGSAEVPVAPESVCVIVPFESYELAESQGGVPDSDKYAFLGAAAGEPFWLLPQSPRAGMPWFGLSTEGVGATLFESGDLELTIVDVHMPDGANLAAWSSDTFGEPGPIFTTASGKLAHRFSVGAHVHFNWGFTSAGTYTVYFQVSGERGGVLEESTAHSLRFLVEP